MGGRVVLGRGGVARSGAESDPRAAAQPARVDRGAVVCGGVVRGGRGAGAGAGGGMAAGLGVARAVVRLGGLV